MGCAMIAPKCEVCNEVIDGKNFIWASHIREASCFGKREDEGIYPDGWETAGKNKFWHFACWSVRE